MRALIIQAGLLTSTQFQIESRPSPVRREDDELGRLVHRGGGARGRWAFDYNPQETADDEPGYRFDSHSFRQGDYVSIRGEDDEMYTFLVVSVEPAS
jgi:hypothetical protein